MSEENPALKERGKVIRDPIHALIPIRADEAYLLDLIDTPEFQRLRRIRQLGVSNITYPGAEHTRFAHSLGVLCFAGRILNHLKLRYQSHPEILDLIGKHTRTVKAAALLHDTGHGPFSHMIERSFKSTASHEQRTALIITDPASKVSEVLKSHGMDPDQVRSVIDGTFPVHFLRDIVSSQLDADRMDYLLRDALMTGVEYGRYDAEWIIHALCLGLDPIQPHDSRNPNHLRLCLDRSRGVHAAEQLIVARMHMSYQVYYHRVTRGWEAHMLCLFRLAHEMAGKGKLPPATPRVVSRFFSESGAISHEDFLSFDEPQMIAALHVWAEQESTEANAIRLGELASAFLQRRKLFHTTDIPGKDPMKASYEKLLSLKDQHKVEGIDYHHDNASFKGYKDFGSSVVHEGTAGDPMEDGSEGIFLADGEPFSHSTIPVEKDSRALITPALIQRGQLPLNRVFELISPDLCIAP
jgi:HD superfamily phosphohydrolase